jgi:hypothetical protein
MILPVPLFSSHSQVQKVMPFSGRAAGRRQPPVLKQFEVGARQAGPEQDRLAMLARERCRGWRGQSTEGSPQNFRHGERAHSCGDDGSGSVG